MNIYGRNIRVEIFGESHGKGVGAVIDGLPAGVEIDREYIDFFMARRRADGNLTTLRAEDDTYEIMSGVYKGYTTGAPLAVFIANKKNKSEDYSERVIIPRPSHADYTAHIKYDGYADMRGGGHFSGRLTAPLVFIGAVITKILSSMGITIGSHFLKVGDISDDALDKTAVSKELLESLSGMRIPCINNGVSDIIREIISDAMNKGDSVGAIIETAAIGLPGGIGSPFFNSVESELSSIIFSIPAIKGVEFGAGFNFSQMYGSEANDEFKMTDGKVVTKTNNNGGILGGITTGMPLIMRCAVKPTASIYKEQNSVNLTTKENVKLSIHGRHDPCVAVRALPVIDAVTAIALYDLIKD
ncbi:MAG: chorismate synthase [Christensenellales bacterium]|jgi:chorismate synthase